MSTIEQDKLTANFSELNRQHLNCYHNFILLQQQFKKCEWRPSKAALQAHQKKHQAQMQQEEPNYFNRLKQTNRITKQWGVLRP